MENSSETAEHRAGRRDARFLERRRGTHETETEVFADDYKNSRLAALAVAALPSWPRSSTHAYPAMKRSLAIAQPSSLSPRASASQSDAHEISVFLSVMFCDTRKQNLNLSQNRPSAPAYLEISLFLKRYPPGTHAKKLSLYQCLGLRESNIPMRINSLQTGM
jgi:hypothetical protein